MKIQNCPLCWSSFQILLNGNVRCRGLVKDGCSLHDVKDGFSLDIWNRLRIAPNGEEKMKRKTKLKLFIWEDFLPDYYGSYGIAFAIAKDKTDAMNRTIDVILL